MSTTTEEESASAVEASQEIPPSPEYRELARDMFEKITEYLNGELSGKTAKILIFVVILLLSPPQLLVKSTSYCIDSTK